MTSRPYSVAFLHGCSTVSTVLFDAFEALIQLSSGTLGSFWVKPQLYKGDFDSLRWVHWRATRMVKGLGRLPCEKQLRELVLIQLGEEMVSWGLKSSLLVPVGRLLGRQMQAVESSDVVVG